MHAIYLSIYIYIYIYIYVYIYIYIIKLNERFVDIFRLAPGIYHKLFSVFEPFSINDFIKK